MVTLKIFYTLHLVLHLFLAKLTECSLLKLLATVFRSSVVKDKEQRKVTLFYNKSQLKPKNYKKLYKTTGM